MTKPFRDTNEFKQIAGEWAHGLCMSKDAFAAHNDGTRYYSELFTLGMSLAVFSSAVLRDGDKKQLAVVDLFREGLFDEVTRVGDLRLFVEGVNEQAQKAYGDFVADKVKTAH